MGFRTEVVFEAERERVFDYLTDARNRPEWQASLRGIRPVTSRTDGPAATWYDVTTVGARPLMRVTEWARPARWTELGTWRGLEISLTLTFADLGTEAPLTLVVAQTETHAPGWRRPLGWALDRLGPRVAMRDLQRAAELLAAA
ncbi:SRPBCC family protein [Nocardioides daejeonensis]|uniref:SRPBCC family protein n=1 Tax=Nocardioides daejeonensis TaxID=1046556 RepID=UPI000D741063|nr:SRPBCC family protein [Nocardioides daejeonensis]